MEMRIVESSIARADLRTIAQNQFGRLVKAVVDVSKNIMVVGGELHADEEQVLLEQGSRQEDLWGINIYPDKSREEWLEFDSMVNLRPSFGNSSRGVENAETRGKIAEIVKQLVAD